MFLFRHPDEGRGPLPRRDNQKTTPSWRTPRPGPRGIVKFRGWFQEGNLVRNGHTPIALCSLHSALCFSGAPRQKNLFYHGGFYQGHVVANRVQFYL